MISGSIEEAERTMGRFNVLIAGRTGVGKSTLINEVFQGKAVERNADGSMTVRFTAGGIKEICWHLVTWGTAVTVEQPACLRQRLAEMCATLAAHHGAAP